MKTRNFKQKKCVMCGNKMNITSGVQKYCSNCRPFAQKKKRMAWKRKQNKNVEIITLTELLASAHNDIAQIQRNNRIIAIMSIIALVASIIAFVL